MTQYDVTYQVGEIISTRSLALFDASEASALSELKRRGLVSDNAQVIILKIEERFGLC